MKKLAFVLLASTLSSTVLAQPPLEGSVKVTKGIASIYRTDVPFANIVNGDPTIVDVSPLTDHSVLFEGKHTGTTNLIFLDKDKRPLTEVMVVVSEQGAGFTRIHNKGNLNSFMSFSCWDNGCEFVGENTVAEPVPLPVQTIHQRIEYQRIPADAPIPALPK